MTYNYLFIQETAFVFRVEQNELHFIQKIDVDEIFQQPK